VVLVVAVVSLVVAVALVARERLALPVKAIQAVLGTEPI
jgi:hypothetical protein